jgi:hypothetical protein
MKQEQLWLSDAGHLVCERISCTGEELYAKIVNGRGLEFTHTIGADRYSRLSASELAEYAPLMAGSGGELRCDGGHIRYDMRAREIRLVAGVGQ